MIELYAMSLRIPYVRTRINKPYAKTSEIPSLGYRDEHTAKTDPLRPSLRQKKKEKKEPDLMGKGNSNILA